MYKFLLILLNFIGGILMINIGLPIITSIYLSTTTAGFICYLLIILTETKRANTDGNQ